MSEIMSLNSAVSYLIENTMEFFTPTAEIKSARVQHSDNCPYMCVQEERRVSEAYECAFLRDKELLSNLKIIWLHVFMTLLYDHKGSGHKTMQMEAENICGSQEGGSASLGFLGFGVFFAGLVPAI